MRIKDTIVSLLVILAATSAQAQITIGGNVYGGGNAGNTGGSTAVTVRGGDISAVYGGARMANVDGSTFVNIDGAKASEDILISNVYGGNDISGTIGQSNVATTVPTELENFEKSAGVNAIDNSWKTFIRTSPSVKYTPAESTVGAVDKYMVVIGTLYGAGNGDYVYKDGSGNNLTDGDGNFIVRDATGATVATSASAFSKPELSKTYLELKGGCIAHAYGGGNAATVTSNTTINIDNSSDDLQKAVTVWAAVKHPGETFADVFNYLQSKLNISTTQSDLTSYTFNFARVFGGNNKADMAIRPKWNLQRGIIRDLYSGGNEGRMTSPEGLLLQIEGDGMIVQNVYGGCRKADVRPLYNNNDATPVPDDEIALNQDDNPNNIPAGYAARVRVLRGHVTNVYGGNDISGNVYGGNTVGILTHIYGNVYGGGNGSYAYTDNPKLKDNPDWHDYYYSPKDILGLSGDTFTGLQSAEALNIFRPNAEKVSILVRGESDKPVIVDGALYVGGNSASLRKQTGTSSSNNKQTHIKIGSYVTIDNVFLGNNGENMVKTNEANASLGINEGVLRTMARENIASDGTKFNSMNLKEDAVFAKYMEGCAMMVNPTVVFESIANGDKINYVPYSTKFGSFFCGGNVGSILVDGKITVDFEDKVIIYDKVVGGCNNAIVNATAYNAEYQGGMLGNPGSVPEGSPAGTIGDKLELNFAGLKIQPKRWNADHTALIWNTVNSSGEEVTPTGLTTGTSTDDDKDRRLAGGNVYGGCYNSGHVNGNVIINLNSALVDRKGEYAIFDETTEEVGGEAVVDNGQYSITARHSGVILDMQGDDVLGKALNVFGGGFGPESEIWGSTTINVKGGYAFQVFGGGEQGPIGKSDANGSYTYNYKIGEETKSKKYSYDPRYSCYVNLRGNDEGVYRGHTNDKTDMAETEYLYGGAFEAPIAGDVVVNLGNGRTYQSFGGSCNADILGHTETYVGRQVNTDGTYTDGGGFPYIRDNIFGGNDLGGQILGEANFKARVNTDTQGKVYNPKNKTAPDVPDVLKASAYMEYIQGRVNSIFGGCYGVYDYTDPHFKDYTYTTGDTDTNTNNIGTARSGFTKPRMNNAFVNFKPVVHARSSVNRIYGAGQGYSGDTDRDIMQARSYILIDDAQASTRFQDMQVFGAGESCGLGMAVSVADAGTNTSGVEAAAVIDLVRGEMAAAYGASFNEGITRRTIVNVPAGSTIKIGSIFGGGYGSNRYLPCDAYEANVNYHSANAIMVYDTIKVANKGAIYGGNNNQRRTLYGRVNITVPVKQQHSKYGMTKGSVYGAGCGGDTWSEYTLVNLENGAEVYEVYGGGQQGKVYNTESVTNFMKPANMPTTWPAGTPKAGLTFTAADWANAWDLGNYNPASGNEYWQDSKTNLANSLVRVAEMDDRDFSGLTDADKAMVQNRYTANVIINAGAYVGNYAYGGGYGADAVVSGTTYIALLGGEVNKDIYAAGTSGSVEDIHGAGVYSSGNQAGFVASANVYVKGGTVRNVYGGGWRGSVGHHGNHTGVISDVANNGSDRDGEVHVVVGDVDGTSHTNGIPSITRNVYGGGEGGAIYGDAYVKINKGYIGYRYKSNVTDNAQTTDFDEHYVPELDDEKVGDNKLDLGGNVFGGGYVANSYVDRSHVTMMGGIVRGSLYGGGEIGPIGRGTVHADSIAIYGSVNHGAAIYKGGETHVYLWDGHVMRDVFGGGRGYDNWGGEGYMTDEEKKTMDKSSKGYVFGSTDVHIYGGEIGTEANVLKGYGNVFGGGNEGFVYSATGTKSSDGYYRDGSSNLSADCRIAVEPQCKVTNDGGITIDGTTYPKGTYVPLEALNKLQSRDHVAAEWAKLDTRGIVIHNALFAGGNITEGSDKIFANTVTVYGNAAASLRDVYNFDLISLGTEEMGGLYGDGNLTLVDGFRELHIDNYGTDYYSLKETMTISEYEKLTARQQAYYKLKYGANEDHTYDYYESQLLHTVNGVSYRKGEKIPRPSDTYNNFTEAEKKNWIQGRKVFAKDEQIEEGEYSLMDGEENETTGTKTGEKAYWTLLGVTSIYAGRPMNTIQRADFCGVFGSRMVMKGAVDRAPQVNGGVDYNSYTINRVEEVSLNKRTTKAGDATNTVDYEHGNYFGIYNSVKFLGNLTSDVAFTDARKTDTKNTDLQADGKSYYAWKAAKPQWKYRNNGISHNKVALASGVYLELKKEETESAGRDVWGYITGVVELDLINVMPGMGGGYVYAKNEHGTRSQVDNVNKVSLLSYNTEAKTYRQFTYATTGPENIETSGNFVHNTKQIVDDCYPNGGIYNDGYVASPAHYWFIRGTIYVYEQYLSAFTGSANATAEKQEIPLNITAASNGRMILRDVQPNFYAYYDKGGNKLGSANADSVFVVNNVSYKLNQAISNWDYNLLSEGDKAKFVNKTYIVVEDCKIGDTTYKKGGVMLESEYNSLKNSNPTIKYMEGDEEKNDGKFDDFFRLSNNLGHDTGYLLTYDINNPMVWNNYYTKTDSPGQANALNTKQYDALTSGKSNYTEGPTYTLRGNSASVFGQQDYIAGNIIYGSAVDNYKKEIYDPDKSINNLGTNPPTQAQVERAYVVKTDYTLKNSDGEVVQELAAGTPIYKSKYASYKIGETTQDLWTGKLETVTEEAKVCTSLLEFSTTDYVWAGKVLTSAEIAEIKTKIKAKNKTWTDDQVTTYLNSYLDNAYYCTKAGKYGGIYFQPGQAYRALDTWCSMPAEERANFDYNYDALDLLIDKDFSGEYGSKTQYDGSNPIKVYSSSQPIDYQAEFVGYEEGGSEVNSISYQPKSGGEVTISTSTAWLSREQYEAIPNEKRHYSPIIITAPGDYYVVRKTFMDGEVPYTTGQQIDTETYESLGSIKQENIYRFTFTADQTNTMVEGKYPEKTYYYCRNSYTINEKGEGKPVTTVAVERNGNGVPSVQYDVTGNNNEVPQGVLIAAGSSKNDVGTYSSLCNFQKGFVIHGTSPTEVSTLYVSNESDINDLSAEKIITVIYLYEYDESDESGLNVTPVSERHILNIHINFKSGVPEIGDINKPDIVLPGTTLGMNIPSVTQGAFRVTESGWEIFSNGDDAATHYNGTPFYNNETPLYFYQDNYWLAYYAQTSLGKTYSKSVKLNVANYHDLKKVMDDKEHHYYIDHKDVERQPKIYINDYSASGENGLDLFKDLIDLSNGVSTNPHLTGHAPLENHTAKPMRGGQYLEFFMKSDLSYPDTDAANEWTPIANNEGECFSGNFHGDGYTISGLDNSLFGHLCGNVYNLGVTGSFTGAGIAETGGGYVENCWISTTSTASRSSMPVFGNPTGLTSDRPYRIVNCYYQEEDNAATTSKYTNHSGTYGIPTRKDSKAFYNGEVAYDLNGFYLYKRYCDQKVTSGNDYLCNYVKSDGTMELKTMHYGTYDNNTALLCSAPYVEKRYEDGDFRFAEGSIPSSEDKRAYTVTDANNNEVTRYAPIWPHDYVFFGQSLTYDYTGAHQNYPSTINKRDGLIVDGIGSNHVHRAPAYFGSKTMGVAHFNPVAILAAYSNPPTETSTDVKEAYPGMTAIDFAGHNDNTWTLGGTTLFYQPLLDDDGLYSIENKSETKNLLVYSPSSEANSKTYTVLNGYFTEAAYSDNALNDGYGSVGIVTSPVFGHLVQSNLKTTTDHLLVDKQDFNCPISYTMGTGKRMWYQRTPDKFVNIESGNTKGWDNISLPFKVSYVTTQQKGEITHFYKGSTTGHEYWLRKFAGNFRPTSTSGVYAADFNLLNPTDPDNDPYVSKNYTNTFLWNYYYSKNGSDDKNGEDYKTYYNESHTYTTYPLEQAGGAYLIGFPGKSYYEFDLSGEWTAANTATPAPAKLDKQTITFASDPAIRIAVSDGEISAGKTVAGGYAYVPNYISKKFTNAGDCYVLADDGASYVKNTANAIVTAFRPYIVEEAKAPARGKDNPNVEQVVFGMDQDTDFLPHDDIIDRLDGTLNIYAKKGKIVVESSLRYTVDVSIYTPAGIAMYKFPVKAGETVEQRINSKGVYIVHSDDGQHMKKVIVR